MKKKIKYGNIPKGVLKIVLGECYSVGDYTLKDELDKYGEDIIYAQYSAQADKIDIFRAWSKKYVFCLVSDLMGDKIVLGLERELPDEYKKL